MNEITKVKNIEHKIKKNKIQNLKQRKFDFKQKNISMSPYKNQKIFLRRPNSNYIPRINNNLLEQSKLSSFSNKINVPNKILVNRKISTIDMHDTNSISFINNSQKRIKNYIYYEDGKQPDKSRLNYYKENKIPKSAKNELKISKSFLNNNVTFTKIYNKEINKGIRGCKSPLNFSFRNKYLDITKELLGSKIYKKERSLNSPSTTNNSNFNDNNSYSSHFLFGKSLMNLNIYPKGINNYFFVDKKFSNKDYNKNIEENSKISTPKLNKINKKYQKKEKDKEILNKTKESFYHSYQYKQKNYPKNTYQIRNIPYNINNKNQTTNDFSTYVNLDYTNYSKIIKSSKYIERKKEPKPKKINKNKKINLVIKYAFLNKAIQDIKRKVDFINPKKGEQITLNTANIQNDNNNTINNNKDFTLVGYELSPKDVYKLFQNKIKKKEIKIKKEKEKENKTLTKYTNKDYFEDKIIRPKFFISQRSDNKLKEIKNYRKIDIKKSENKKQQSNDETLEYIKNKNNILYDINDIYFGFGESLNKNKLDYNMITDIDKTEGKILWSKIYKSSLNILKKAKSKVNIKSKVDSNIEKIKQIKSARTRRKTNFKKRKLNQKDIIRRKQKKNYTHKIDTLEQHKLFRNEGGFNEIKQEENNIYNIDFRITDESDEDTINEVIEEQKRKEEQDNIDNINSLAQNQISRNSNRSNKKRNTIVDLNPFNNKLYKLKKTSLKILQNKLETKIKNNFNNNNIEDKIQFKEEEEKIIKQSNKKTREEKIIQYRINNRNKIKKLKAQKEKEKIKLKEKKEKIIPKKYEQDNTINILKDNSMEIKNNKILKELNTSIDSDNDIFYLSYENEYDIKIENVIKKPQKRRSTLLFDRFFRNYKINMKNKKYKEDEKMQKYFDDIFNKYEKNNNNDNNELIDIKFFGLDLKIKKKNQINFKNIIMKNIREQNLQQKENKIINTKLNLILERFNQNKNKNKIYNKNLDIYKTSKIYRLQKRKSRLIYKKELEKNKKNLDKEKKEQIEEKNEQFQSQFFFGKRMNSIDEFEKKKDEILNLIEDDIRDRIIKGDMERSEMKQFLEFQKRMNAYQIDKNNKDSFIQLLEQEFISFQDQIKIHEQKLKEEKRLNKFLNRLNDDIQKDFYFKKFQTKIFCNVIDYNEKNIINLLSTAKEMI